MSKRQNKTADQGSGPARVISGKTVKLLNGVYYRFDCMNAFINNGLYPVRDFAGDAEAERIAADYEATLIKYEYQEGMIINSTVIYDPREH